MADRDQSRVVFSTRTLRIGQFRCPPHHPSWRSENHCDAHLVVFPRVGVRITHVGADPIVADPNTVMFYNPGSAYRRALLTDRGDSCEWFSIAPDLLAEAAAVHDPTARDRPGAIFPFTCGPSTASVYLAQRRAYHRALAGPRSADLSAAPASSGEPLAIEESAISIISETVAAAFDARGTHKRRSPAITSSAAAAAQHAKAVIAANLDESLSLARIADEVGLSPYHLCRTFKHTTGQTLHRYLIHARLRASLERLCDPRESLLRIALGFRFSSHAHFSRTFRRAFGLTPMQARETLAPRQIRRLSKIVQAGPQPAL